MSRKKKEDVSIKIHLMIFGDIILLNILNNSLIIVTTMGDECNPVHWRRTNGSARLLRILEDEIV